MWDKGYDETLQSYRSKSREAGGKQRIEKQHNAQKLTARERLEIFFDKGTFVEIGNMIETRISDFGLDKKKVPGDGVITGYGLVLGRMACASFQDFTVVGGTLGEYHSKKICDIMDKAYQMRVPYISVNDSGGARIEEGISALSGYSGIFYRNTRNSGVIPQIAVILGPCAGGACYSPAICDFVFMSQAASYMFITGPKVVEAAVGEKISQEDLGGADVHMRKSGVAHFAYPDDVTCLEGVKRLLSYLPQSNQSKPPYHTGIFVDRSGEIETIVPDNQRRVYDIHKVIDSFVDKGSFFEVQPEYAENICIGFARLDGDVIGIIANQAMHLGGSLDSNASEKAARFIRFCDCFKIPLLTLVDVPGFLPGKEQEQDGIVRRGAKLLYAYAEATVPKVTLIMRKAYGGAYIAMNSKEMGADMVYAWPIAQLAVMGAEGAVDIIYKKDLKEGTKSREECIREYEKNFMTPYLAASRGLIDEVISPSETRDRLSKAFQALKDKELEPCIKKHGNIPL